MLHLLKGLRRMKKHVQWSFFATVLLMIAITGCHVRKGYEALDVYNYFEAKNRFEKAIERNTSPAAYGLSQIYFRNDNPFHNIDSAYHYGLLAVETFDEVDTTKQQKWNEQLDYSLKKAREHREQISEYFFHQAVDSNTVTAMKYFIAKNPWSPRKEEAEQIRDSLAYLNAQEKGNSEAYANYLKNYPESSWIEDAQEALYQAQFDETIIPNQIESYSRFISKFPNNPLVKEARRRIYQLATKNNTIEEYESFLKKYLDSPFREDAWKNLYRLSIADYQRSSIVEFRDNHPEFPFPNMIETDLSLVGKELFLFKQNGKYGFMNRSGESMIDAQFDFASNFSNGLAVVVKENKFGYIDKSGEVVIDYQFDEAQDFVQGRAIVEKDGFFGLIDPTGDYVMNANYLDIGSLNEGLFYAETDDGFSYYTLDGSVAFDTEFDEAFAFENGIAKVTKAGVTGYIRKDGSWVVNSTRGDLRQFKDTLFVLELRDSTTFYGPSGEYGNQYYDRIGGLRENRAIVTKGDQYGYVNGAAEVVIPIKKNAFPNYFQFAQFENGHALVYRQERYAMMDSLGKNVLPAIFTGVGTYGPLIPVSKGDGWGYTDERVRLQIDYQYDYAYGFRNGRAIVELDNFVGMIDLEGNEVIPIEYDDLTWQEGDYYVYQQMGRVGLINTQGEDVLRKTFQRISKLRKGLLRLEDQEEIAYFDITKKELITLKQ